MGLNRDLAPDSVAPGPGTVVIADERGVRIRPWQESATRGAVGKMPPIVPGMTEDDMREHIERHQPQWAANPVIQSDFSTVREVPTTPPIVKTSGRAKRERLLAMFQSHIDSWRAMLGRPVLVGDLSPGMRHALHLGHLPLSKSITSQILERAARRYLLEAENQMRATQAKRSAKEPFYTAPMEVR